MKIGVMSDPHFHAYKNHSTIIDGINSRLLDVENAWKQAVNKMIEMECELLLVAGDFFHVRGSIKPSTYNRVFGLMQWTTQRLPVIAIPGNHDMEDFKGGSTAIDTFHEIGGFFVAESESEVEVVSSGGVGVACIPYHKNLEGFVNTARGVCTDEVKIVIVHQGFDDYCNPGMPGEGFSVAMARELFGDRWVLAGHYHTPAADGKCIQVGAPLQHNFGDEGLKRGFWVIDTETDQAEHFELKTPRFCTIRSAEDAADGEFIRIKVPTVAEGEKLAKKLKSATDIVIQLERDFVTFHEETIELSTPVTMLSQYMGIKPEHKKNAGPLMSLFKEVCDV
jgi:DNA repair exonuclease SbcCD nuclease subunit